jgi:hypothetical protein
MKKLFTLALVASLVACKGPEQAEIKSAPLKTFSEAEIKGTAKALLAKKGVGEEESFGLQKRLEEMLADPETKKRMESPGCNAVGVFQFGSGGLLIAGGAGSGLVSFAGGSGMEPFSARAMSVGAIVGGENAYGVLLVFGLQHEERFTDSYRFEGTGGTLAQTSYRVGQAKPKNGTHVIQYMGHGTGVSGSAAVAQGRLVLDRDAANEPKEEPAKEGEPAKEPAKDGSGK